MKDVDDNPVNNDPVKTKIISDAVFFLIKGLGKHRDANYCTCLIKVTGHAWYRSSENHHCALDISLIFIKFSLNIRWCMKNFIKLLN